MIRSCTTPRLEDNSGGVLAGQAADQEIKDTRNVVLVVEDEPISSNGTEGLELIANRPHVLAVVSDIAMPGSINGFELAREVQRRWPQIGLVLVSGQMEPLNPHFPGGAFFLSKPFKASTLLRLLRDMAERRVPSQPPRVCASREPSASSRLQTTASAILRD